MRKKTNHLRLTGICSSSEKKIFNVVVAAARWILKGAQKHFICFLEGKTLILTNDTRKSNVHQEK